MIAYVSGKLVEKKPTEIVVDVHGLGYHLLIPTSTYENLPASGETVKLYTHQHVREDTLQLYGFSTRAERSMFELIITVSGIGPKLGLAALSTMPARELSQRIAEGAAEFLTRIPGVGKKVAQRMVVELKDRVIDVAGGDGVAPLADAAEARHQARSDALAALEALGLSRAAAERNLRKVLRSQPGIQSVEEMIRLALKEG